MSEGVPRQGDWPVDPQKDVPVSKDRIWVDGCFDFSHHGMRVYSAISFILDSENVCQDTLAPCCKLGDWAKSSW